MQNCDNCKYELVYFFDEPCVNCGRFKNWEPVNNVDKLVLLVGASGSGKTTIAKELEKKGINIIHSYTTREPREPNEWGHIFIKDGGFTLDFDGLVGQQDGIATTNYGKPIAFFEGYGAVYFATKEQYEGKGTSIYVIDPSGAKEVQETLKNDYTVEVVTIFLIADQKTRYDRMLSDGRAISDILDRIESDREIFSTAKCDYVVDANDHIEYVVDKILTLIEGDK